MLGGQPHQGSASDMHFVAQQSSQTSSPAELSQARSQASFPAKPSQTRSHARSLAELIAPQGDAVRDDVSLLRQQVAEMAQAMRQQQELMVQMQAMVGPRLQQPVRQQHTRRGAWLHAAGVGSGSTQRRMSGMHQRSVARREAISTAAQAGALTLSSKSSQGGSDAEVDVYASSNVFADGVGYVPNGNSMVAYQGAQEEGLDHVAPTPRGTGQNSFAIGVEQSGNGAVRHSSSGCSKAEAGQDGEGDEWDGGQEGEDEVSCLPVSMFSMHAGERQEIECDGEAAEYGVEAEYSLALMAATPLSSSKSLGSSTSLGAMLSLGPADALPDGEACAFLAAQPPSSG